MKPRLNQTGQAVTEYILILIIALAIIIVVSDRVFTPVKKWTDYYLGTYTACLLDYGVLPGDSGGTLSECQQQAIGAGMTGSGSSADNGDKKSGSDDANSAKKSAADAEAARANAALRRNSNNRGSAQNGGRRVQDSEFGRQSGVTDKSTGDEHTTVMKVAEGPNLYRRNSRWNRNYEKPIKVRGISGIVGDEVEKIARAGEARSSKIDAEIAGPSPKRIPFKKPTPRATASESEESTSFSIGYLFRLALMLIIIVGIVYVVGGQLNSVSKSMDD